ncbi:uncharacterized protein LOC127121887 [Lathyrus oleraceus]|uniref:uncharacterized protein LOC127121887 n=1 Tax=Pisum sativum TaxID=3888 RepID=UPI0021D359A9|nr:uncharacterized protein LOC127121887 [Pisum sativum]
MSGDLSDKEENFREKKDQSIDTVNIDDLDSDYESIGKILAPGIAKRLKRRKGKVVEFSNKPLKALRRSTNIGPTKGWSKVVTHATKKRFLKRKEVPYDIVSATRKKASRKKIPTNILEVPIDNISFHSVKNVEKWKFIYQRRLDLERELGKYSIECKEVMGLIQEVGLIKSVTGFGKCYETLVKEFIVNISKECDKKRSKEFREVYVRGRCVDFSPEIINKVLGRNEEEQAEVEVPDNLICREIIIKQVKE